MMKKMWNEKGIWSKKVLLAVFSLLMCFILSMTAQNKAWAAYIEYAEDVSVDGTVYNGIIISDLPSNYYRFTLESSGMITLTATAEIHRVNYYIYDESGNTVWENRNVWANDTTGQSNIKVGIDLIKGTYYFTVEENHGTGNYSFQLTYFNAEENFTETASNMNNSISTANSISLDTKYKGQIAANDDKDYYKFTLDSSGQIMLKAIAEIYRVNYYIYDSSGNKVWENQYVQANDTTGESNIEPGIDLIKGTYYFIIEGYAGTGNYSFCLSYSNAKESFTETASNMNNSISTANNIYLDTEYKGQIAANDGKDYYKFTLDFSGQITLKAIAEIYWVNYYIYDESGNTVWKDQNVRANDTTGQSNIEVGIDLIKGIYYFTVEEYAGTGNYSFQLAYFNAEESFIETASDMDNSISTANNISLPTEYKGQIATNDPKDYYKFTLDSSGRVTLTAIAKIYRVNYYIYDSLGNEVWRKIYVYANDITGQSDIEESIDLGKGTYYFLVNEAGAEAGYTGNYSFKLTKYIDTPMITSISNVSSGVKIKWTSVSDAKGYYIYRRTGSLEWEKVKTTSSTNWTDKNTSNGTDYAYKIYAYSTDAISNVGEDFYQQIHYLTAPKFSSIENTAAGKVTLNWSKNSKATGYQIKYKTGSTSKTVTVYSYKTVKKVLLKLKKGQKYNIYIRAYYQPENSEVKYYSAWSTAESILIRK